MKNKFKIFMLCICALVSSAQIASAHSMWLSVFESHNHEPGHVLSIIGWGHNAPIDDLLSSTTASAKIAKYTLTAPDGKIVSLMPPDSSVKVEKSTKYGDVITGELGVKKITINKDAPKGTYQLAITSKEGFFTRYINKKGKQKMATKPIDQLKNVAEVIESFKYSMNAKAFYTNGEWTAPKSSNFDLEILPTSDLSNVRKGDKVAFDVSFMGKPVNTDSNAIRYMTLTSDTFGGPDGFFLSTYIINGKANFRVPTAGHYVANVYYSQATSPKGNLAKLAKKCKKVFSCATVSFTVKP